MELVPVTNVPVTNVPITNVVLSIFFFNQNGLRVTWLQPKPLGCGINRQQWRKIFHFFLSLCSDTGVGLITSHDVACLYLLMSSGQNIVQFESCSPCFRKHTFVPLMYRINAQLETVFKNLWRGHQFLESSFAAHQFWADLMKSSVWIWDRDLFHSFCGAFICHRGSNIIRCSY